MLEVSVGQADAETRPVVVELQVTVDGFRVALDEAQLLGANSDTATTYLAALSDKALHKQTMDEYKAARADASFDPYEAPDHDTD